MFPTEPIVYLNETAGTDPGAAPIGGTNLFAVVTSPACEPHLDWEGRQEEFKGRVLGIMRRFGLGFEPEEVELERIQTPRYFEREHGNYKGSLYGPDEKHRLFGGLFPPVAGGRRLREPLLLWGLRFSPGRDCRW